MKAIPGIIVGLALAVGAAKAAPYIDGNYYEDVAYSGCGTAAETCRVTFSAIPAGKRLTVTRVSCRISVVSPKVLNDLRLSAMLANGSITREQFLEFPASTPEPPVRQVTNVNRTTSMPFKPGTRPVVQGGIDQPGTINLGCQISGRIEPL